MICGKTVYKVPVCKKCINEHLNVDKALNRVTCEICGKELLSTEKNCMACRELPVIFSIDKNISLFSYRLWNKNLMFEWKSNEIRSISLLFAKIFSQVLLREKIKFIVPIPPRPGKIREKGWDQIDEVTEILVNKYKFIRLNLLCRKTKIQQKKLDKTQRLKSMENSYSVVEKEKFDKEIRKFKTESVKKVALIDDVCTTGATLECCSKILKQHGIEFVEAVTLFRVD